MASDLPTENSALPVADPAGAAVADTASGSDGPLQVPNSSAAELTTALQVISRGGHLRHRPFPAREMAYVAEAIEIAGSEVGSQLKAFERLTPVSVFTKIDARTAALEAMAKFDQIPPTARLGELRQVVRGGVHLSSQPCDRSPEVRAKAVELAKTLPGIPPAELGEFYLSALKDTESLAVTAAALHELATAPAERIPAEMKGQIVNKWLSMGGGVGEALRRDGMRVLAAETDMPVGVRTFFVKRGLTDEARSVRRNALLASFDQPDFPEDFRAIALTIGLKDKDPGIRELTAVQLLADGTMSDREVVQLKLDKASDLPPHHRVSVVRWVGNSDIPATAKRAILVRFQADRSQHVQRALNGALRLREV